MKINQVFVRKISRVFLFTSVNLYSLLIQNVLSSSFKFVKFNEAKSELISLLFSKSV